MDKTDWFIIQEAMCYASHNEEEFKKFMKRNKNWKVLHKRYDRDISPSGHKLIGLLFGIMNYPKYH